MPVTLSESGACDTLWSQETNLCVCVSEQKGSLPSSLTAQRAGAMVRGENSLESDNLCDLEQLMDFL